MKHWYVITPQATQRCEFIGVNLNLGYMYLRYCGVRVRFIIIKEQYNLAKNGVDVTVFATSKKGNKQVNVVFK